MEISPQEWEVKLSLEILVVGIAGSKGVTI
jgi:hypothetical protein